MSQSLNLIKGSLESEQKMRLTHCSSPSTLPLSTILMATPLKGGRLKRPRDHIFGNRQPRLRNEIQHAFRWFRMGFSSFLMNYSRDLLKWLLKDLFQYTSAGFTLPVHPSGTNMMSVSALSPACDTILVSFYVRRQWLLAVICRDFIGTPNLFSHRLMDCKEALKYTPVSNCCLSLVLPFLPKDHCSLRTTAHSLAFQKLEEHVIAFSPEDWFTIADFCSGFEDLQSSRRNTSNFASHRPIPGLLIRSILTNYDTKLTYFL